MALLPPTSQPDPKPLGFYDPAGKASSLKESAGSRTRVGVGIPWPAPLTLPASLRSEPAFHPRRAKSAFRPVEIGDESFRRNGSQSLASQSDQRINFRRSPRRNPAGQQRDSNHKSRRHAKRQRIELADVYQRNGQQTGNRCAAGQANENPDCNKLAALPQEECDDITTLRAQGHTNADFAGTLADDERHHAVESYRRKRQRQQPQRAGQQGNN